MATSADLAPEQVWPKRSNLVDDSVPRDSDEIFGFDETPIVTSTPGITARLHFLTDVLDCDVATSQTWDVPEPARRITPAHAHSRPGGDSRVFS